MNSKLMKQAFSVLAETIDEGIHIIDELGNSVVYNSAMESLEGLSKEEVLDKHLKEVFPGANEESSTLLKALSTGRTVDQQKQSYINYKGKRISSINTTYPIMSDNQVIGAIEVARNYTEVSHLSEQIVELQEKLINPRKREHAVRKHYTFENLIGQNKKYLEAIKIARKASLTSSSVLIYGETGTGKELFAQSIHYESNRKDRPFIAINCAALPETLLESLLFGTEKGSFTGAVERVGLFEQADGGTLFLDEINSMSIHLQAKLLRVLQEGYLRRVGGLKDIEIDVRIIAATNEPLEQILSEKLMRKDLFYRLNVLSIYIPSLKERQEDILVLTDFFIRHFNGKLKKDIWMLSRELQELFLKHSWPGNVRELQNVIESAMNVVGEEHAILKEHLQEHALQTFGTQREALIQQRSAHEPTNINEHLQNEERKIIISYLKLKEYNITKAAQMLGISRQNLQYRIKILGIECKE